MPKYDNDKKIMPLQQCWHLQTNVTLQSQKYLITGYLLQPHLAFTDSSTEVFKYIYFSIL